MLLGEIMTRPASLTTGDAATAAAEQFVPMTPVTCGSPTIPSAPARPPSGEQLVSTGSPSSTSRPWMGPRSSAANSAACRDTAASDGATVTDSSIRIRTASPGASVTTPSGPGSNGGGAVALSHASTARTVTSAGPGNMMRLRMRPHPPQSSMGASPSSTGVDDQHDHANPPVRARQFRPASSSREEPRAERSPDERGGRVPCSGVPAAMSAFRLRPGPPTWSCTHDAFRPFSPDALCPGRWLRRVRRTRPARSRPDRRSGGFLRGGSRGRAREPGRTGGHGGDHRDRARDHRGRSG